MSRRAKAFLIAFVALMLVPISAMAANRFADVPDSNIFHDDIAWMADTKVTYGCNPPANNLFCPKEHVTREQMAAFFHRFARNQVVDAGAIGGVTSSELNNHLDGLDGQVSDLGDGLTTLGSNVTDIGGQVEDLGTAVDELETTVEELEFGGLETEFNTVVYALIEDAEGPEVVDMASYNPHGDIEVEDDEPGLYAVTFYGVYGQLRHFQVTPTNSAFRSCSVTNVGGDDVENLTWVEIDCWGFVDEPAGMALQVTDFEILGIG